MKQALCDVCAEPIWAEERERPLCMEHLFTEEFPALAKLTDQVREQEQRPGSLRQEDHQAARTNHQKEEVVMSKYTAPDHTDLDMLDRLADSIRGYRAPEPLKREDLDAPDLTGVEELAERFNVLPSTVLYVAQLLADDSEDIIAADVWRIFDTARHDARRMGFKLPQEHTREGGRPMKPFTELCCFDPDSIESEGPCDQDLLRARLDVVTVASRKISAVTVSDIFQHANQVNALRLEIIDEDEKDAILTLEPEQLKLLGEWLIEKAQQLYPAGDSR